GGAGHRSWGPGVDGARRARCGDAAAGPGPRVDRRPPLRGARGPAAPAAAARDPRGWSGAPGTAGGTGPPRDQAGSRDRAPTLRDRRRRRREPVAPAPAGGNLATLRRAVADAGPGGRPSDQRTPADPGCPEGPGDGGRG